MKQTISQHVASKFNCFRFWERNQLASVTIAVSIANGICGTPQTKVCGFMNEIHEYSSTPAYGCQKAVGMQTPRNARRSRARIALPTFERCDSFERSFDPALR